MSKAFRQYFGCFCAVIGYYLVHEGAHLLYAFVLGTFRQIRFLGLGIQIDVYAERMTQGELAVFCISGAVATAAAGYLLTAFTHRIARHPSRLLKACLYYLTIAFLFADPLYLSILCGFFGGGDMNGIALVIPEAAARCLFGCLLIANAVLFTNYILPKYRQAFSG